MKKQSNLLTYNSLKLGPSVDRAFILLNSHFIIIIKIKTENLLLSKIHFNMKKTFRLLTSVMLFLTISIATFGQNASQNATSLIQHFNEPKGYLTLD